MIFLTSITRSAATDNLRLIVRTGFRPSVSGDLVFMGKQSDQHPQALKDPREFRMNWSAVHKRQHESYQHRLHI